MDSGSPAGMDLVAEARRNWVDNDLGEVDAMVAATSIARAHQIVLGRINQALSQFSLTFSRYEALALLSCTLCRWILSANGYCCDCQ